MGFAVCPLVFVTSERGDGWRFTFQRLVECIFLDLPLPHVVIADLQGLGLRPVFADVWPSAILQFCEWNAAQNIKKRWPKPTIRGKTETKYLWPATEDELELERNDAELMARIREGSLIDRLIESEIFPPLVPSTFSYKAKSHDKTTK
jgi:hypothetical protein